MSKNTWVVSVGTRVITSMVTRRVISPSVIHDHRISHRTASDTQHKTCLADCKKNSRECTVKHNLFHIIIIIIIIILTTTHIA